MSRPSLRIATRDSPLALWQAHHVRAQLEALWPGLSIQLIPMKTSGDRFLNTPLQALGGKGLFVKELEEALLDNRADFAVHSMKDLPATQPLGLQLTVICKRETPFDALVSNQYKHLSDLPLGARIGTSSLRRQMQLMLHRPDLCISPLRGNVGTRLAALDAGRFDAIMLAAAGLERLNLSHRITQVLPESIMVPACGQGALGIECREQDTQLHSLLAPLHDPLTAVCVNTERQVNAALGGSCHTPIGLYCQQLPTTAELNLQSIITNGTEAIGSTQTGTLEEAADIAARSVQALFQQGAQRFIQIK